MRTIKFIYFDLGKVILNFDPNIAYRQAAAVAAVPEEAIRKFICESGLQNRFETGLIDGTQYHAEFCEGTGSRPAKEDLLLAISDMFEVKQRMIPLLTQLKAIGFPIGILSNTCTAHWGYVSERHAFLRHFFDPVIVSYLAKSMKPDLSIYEQAIEAVGKVAGVSANQIFFTDDRQENVDGAIAAGIDASLFTSVDQLAAELRERGIRVNL